MSQSIIGQQQYGQQMYPSIMSAPLSMYGAMGDVGAQRRSMTQASMDRDMARYDAQANAPQQALADYMAMIQGNYGGTTHGTQTVPGPSGLQQVGQIAAIAAPFIMASDIRVKENIIPVGNYKGLGVYEYSYVWSPQRWIGVMAQEVEKVLPDAVVEIGGIKHVNYALL
jgi:hypothetical protein